VDAEGARDLLVDEVRAAVDLRALVLRRFEDRRLRRLARDAQRVTCREVERREHDHVARRVARAQQRVELDRARRVPRGDRKHNRPPDLHVRARAVDVDGRRAQRLFREARAVVEVVDERVHLRAVLRVDRAHGDRRLRVRVQRGRDVLERVPQVEQVLDRRDAHGGVLLRDRRPERHVRRDAVCALLDDCDLLERVLHDREVVEDEDIVRERVARVRVCRVRVRSGHEDHADPEVDRQRRAVEWAHTRREAPESPAHVLVPHLQRRPSIWVQAKARQGRCRRADETSFALTRMLSST
jgi:hypothetical protein